MAAEVERLGTMKKQAVACKAVEILQRIGDKWSLYVIHTLCEGGTLRFSELRRGIDGISQRMLTVTLRNLERDGLVRRTIYPEIPPRVEYQLTPLGGTLRGVVGALVTWTEAHLAEIEAARARFDAGELDRAQRSVAGMSGYRGA